MVARLADTLINSAYALGRAPMTNLQLGGQNGYAPNLRELNSSQSYTRNHLVCLLVEAPKGFQYLPDPAFWVGALKAIVELHPKSIEGFNAGLEVEVSETAVSGGGEMQQDPTNVTRARSTPSFSFVDKYGRPIQSFMEGWIRGLIGDPDSKVPDIATNAGQKPSDLLSDMYGATMLFFEPDPTYTRISKAWLTTNMYPKSTGEITGKRDLTTAKELSEFTIDFTGISQTGLGVNNFAQKMLDRINITNANPFLQPAFVQDIAPDVAAAGRGYKERAEELGSTAVIR